MSNYNGTSANHGVKFWNIGESSNNRNDDNNYVTELHDIYEEEIVTIKTINTITERDIIHKPDITADVNVLIIESNKNKLIIGLLDRYTGSNVVTNLSYKVLIIR